MIIDYNVYATTMITRAFNCSVFQTKMYSYKVYVVIQYSDYVDS